jgi:uncharacterized protein (DUF3084 family)
MLANIYIENLTTNIARLDGEIAKAKSLDRLKEIMSDLSLNMEEASYQFTQNGDKASYTQSKLSALYKALKHIKDNVSAGTEGMQGDIDNIISQMKPLEAYMKKLQDWEKVAKVFDILSSAVGSYMQVLDNQKQRQLNNIDEIAKTQNKSDKWVTAEKEKINKQYARKQKAWAIAQILINAAVASIRAWVEGGPAAPFLQALIAAQAIGAVAVVNSQAMAKGGIIPKGYPNDTFPARLSSDEAVIPLDRLGSIFRNIQPMGQQQGQVVFRIEGKELVGILQTMDKYGNSY